MRVYTGVDQWRIPLTSATCPGWSAVSTPEGTSGETDEICVGGLGCVAVCVIAGGGRDGATDGLFSMAGGVVARAAADCCDSTAGAEIVSRCACTEDGGRSAAR